MVGADPAVAVSKVPGRPEPRYLGVDAGGTFTRSALIDATGRVLARGAAGAANHHTSDGASVRASVREAVRGALASQSQHPQRPREASETPATSLASAAGAAGAASEAAAHGSDVASIRALAIGWSGLEAPGSEAEARAIVGDAVRAERMVLDSDVTAAHVGAFWGGPGVLVAAGTGSIALGVDSSGRRVRAGGWGHRFGDEGSAVWLATEGIRSALRAVDGRGPPTSLWEALLGHAGIAPAGHATEALAVAVTDWLYAPARHVNDVAAFARYVHGTTVAGDTVAMGVIEAGGRELAQLVAAAACQLGTPGPLALAGVGGVWENAPEVRAACRAALASLLPDAAIHWVEPATDPAVGAALMALRADGLPLPERTGASKGRP